MVEEKFYKFVLEWEKNIWIMLGLNPAHSLAQSFTLWLSYFDIHDKFSWKTTNF